MHHSKLRGLFICMKIVPNDFRKEVQVNLVFVALLSRLSSYKLTNSVIYQQGSTINMCSVYQASIHILLRNVKIKTNFFYDKQRNTVIYSCLNELA